MLVFLIFLDFCQKMPKNCHFFIFGGQFFFHTHLHYLWPTFLKFWTVSSGLKYSNMHTNMNKTSFSNFSWFCAENCPKMTIFFIFGGQFFYTHPHYLLPTILQLWIGSSGLKCSNMLKYIKKANFSWFFCQKWPKNGNFLIFVGQYFFLTHPPYLWPTIL